MLSFREILCLALCLQTVICRPTEEPTKFSFKLVEDSHKAERNGPTMFQQGMVNTILN